VLQRPVRVGAIASSCSRQLQSNDSTNAPSDSYPAGQRPSPCL